VPVRALWLTRPVAISLRHQPVNLNPKPRLRPVEIAFGEEGAQQRLSRCRILVTVEQNLAGRLRVGGQWWPMHSHSDSARATNAAPSGRRQTRFTSHVR
jgi:hypothetical protein